MPMPQVLADVQSLMKRIDIEDIETIATEADAAFGDGAADLRSLTIEMEQAVALMLTIEPDMVRTLKAAKVPLRTVKERRSEERRGGKEGVSTCRAWWSPCLTKKKKKQD